MDEADWGGAERRDRHLKQRGVRVWLAVVSVAVVAALFSLGVTGSARNSDRNFDGIERVVSCTEVGGECFERVAERQKAVSDADRKLLAQEIVCFAYGACPPGMDRDSIPGFQGLVPPAAP